MYYEEAGPPDGRPVLLVHGLGGHCGHWTHHLPALADAGYRAVAADWPGHNRSSRDIPGFTFETVIDGYAELAEKLFGGRRAAVAGHSAGGAVAQMLYHRDPGRVGALLLLQTGFSFVGPLARSMASPLVPLYTSLVFSRSLKGTADAALKAACGAAEKLLGAGSPPSLLLSRGSFDAERRVAAAEFRNLIEMDLSAQLNDIDAPVLIVCARFDHIVPLRHAKRMRDEIAGSEFRVINYVGHNAHVLRAAEVNAAMLDFLATKFPPAE